MAEIQVKNIGIKFTLRHEKYTTLLGTIVSIFGKKGTYQDSGNETFWALRNLSFSVRDGESFGVIGKNGAGKSTLLQVLTGIYKPDEGIVERKGRIGLLQIGTGFHPDLSGKENIYLNGAILGLK